MRFPGNHSRARKSSGIMLIECMVYLTVFLVLSGVALGTFYICWDGFRAMIGTTDDTSAALRAGEHWRSDVRSATGVISVDTTTVSQIVKIPEGRSQIIYTFESGNLRRQVGAAGVSQLVLPEVKSSEMKREPRGGVTAWRWELQLQERQRGPHLPMLFTFESVQKQP